MAFEFQFKRTLGQTQVKNFIIQAIEHQTFPQAILFHGMRGAGQIPLLLDLTDILACQATEGKRPCGTCRGCKPIGKAYREQISSLVPLEKSTSSEKFQTQLQSKLENIDSLPYGSHRRGKENVGIEQVRDLQESLQFRERLGRRRVLRIFWPEKMLVPAANCLLKTLEEPPGDTFFILGSENRSGLLPTILSRCVQIHLPPLPEKDIRASEKTIRQWLGEDFVPEAIPLSQGSPGLLMDLCLDGGGQILTEAVSFLTLVLDGNDYDFVDYVESSSYLNDMGEAMRFLDLCERILGHWHRKIMEKRKNENEGLLTIPQPAQNPANLAVIADGLAKSRQAISHFARPGFSLIGGYFEWSAKLDFSGTAR